MRRNKTMRRKLQHRQRSRRHRFRHRHRHTRRQRGGDLPVPSGALVGISTGGEYGRTILVPKDQAEDLLDRGSLEE